MTAVAVIVTGFIILEGLVVFFWPQQVKAVLAEASPSLLRLVAAGELGLGLMALYAIFRAV